MKKKTNFKGLILSCLCRQHMIIFHSILNFPFESYICLNHQIVSWAFTPLFIVFYITQHFIISTIIQYRFILVQTEK